jgi:hypothetical protein
MFCFFNSHCPYSSNGMKAEGNAIIPHRVGNEREHKEVILQTPFGTFHRNEPNQGSVIPSPKHEVSSSPEPLEMDVQESKAMPTLSPVRDVEDRKRPGDAIEKDPKVGCIIATCLKCHSLMQCFLFTADAIVGI